MNPPRDEPSPSSDDSSATPAEPRTKKRRHTGIQVDAYGIKADLRPREIGEPTPQSWREVRDAVHSKLMVIAVNLAGVVEDGVIGTRKFIRGLADIPAAAARRIDRAHERADRKEAIRQEKLEARQLPPPDSSHVVDEIEALLGELRAEGAAVGVEERAEGSTAIVIVRPEHRQIAAQLAHAALPSPGPTSTATAPQPVQDVLPPPDPTSTAIASVFPSRIAIILEEHDIEMVADLASRSAGELLLFDGFGEKSLTAVRRTLARFNLKLRDD